MERLHISKKSYDGYCVGSGVEYPGIILHAKTDEELKNKFMAALPEHQKALQKFTKTKKTNITVISFENKKPA